MPIAGATRFLAGSVASTTESVTPAASGCLLVALVTGFLGAHANHAVSDSVDGAWTKLGGYDGSTGNFALSAWVKAPSSTTARTVTIDLGSGGSYPAGVVYHATERDNSTPFVAGELAGWDSGAVQTTTPQTASLTSSDPDALYLALLATSISVNPGTLTENDTGTLPSGDWAQHANAENLDGVNFTVFGAPYREATSAVAHRHDWLTTSAYAVSMILALQSQAASLPQILAGPTLTDRTTTTLTFTATTDVATEAWIEYGTTTDRGTHANPTASGTSHTIVVGDDETPLAPNTAYYIRLWVRTASGDEVYQELEATVSTASGTTAGFFRSHILVRGRA